MLRIRIDVDYPYPSRTKSIIYTATGLRMSSEYLKNSKIVAKMINESAEEVKAYWFFTLKTVPDRELLSLIDNDKHEIGLHVVNNPEKEKGLLEAATGKKLNYYTIHGTARLMGRIVWRRWKAKKPTISPNFQLRSFHQFKTSSLDVECHVNTTEQCLTLAKGYAAEGHVLHFHPIWLFQRGKMNYRGPFYETLRRLLGVDEELETLAIRKKSFVRIARDQKEYEEDVFPTPAFIRKLGERDVDIFTFIERKWCNTLSNPPRAWLKAEDDVALLKVATYDEWWKNVGKKTRNMIRKAEKSGVKTEVVEPNEKLAEGIWKIYNETPIRQERAFPHYGVSLQIVTRRVLSERDNTFIGALFQGELAGFIQLVHGDRIALVSQLLSLQKHADKAVNNALIAKAVEVCATKQSGWLLYGRIGNHPSLDRFKQSSGFTRFPLTRYYVPVTKKGRVAVKLGLHREIKDALPQAIKYPLFPVYNWISRNKMRIKLRLAS